MDIRLTFEEAVYDPLLLKPWFDDLSFAQQACLLAAYGCALDDKETDSFGWTRLDYYWASQGHADYDDDGYILRVNRADTGPYIPHEYSEVWVVAGVRGGKSDRLAATAVVYEALFGGHEQHIREGKLGYCLQICQDLRLARASIFGIEATLKEVPFMLTPAPPKSQWAGKHGERIGRRTADFLRLWNGMSVMTMPPTVKAVRGYDAPVSVLDEVGIWPTGEDSANVDKEVYSQAKSRQAQFTSPKTIGISSPWINSGLLYDRFKLGTKGHKLLCASCIVRAPLKNCPTCKKAREGWSNLLVCHFTTASLGNPLITREWLREQRLADPLKFRRECLALFDSPAGAFLSSTLLDSAVDLGIHERPSAYVLKQGELHPTYLPVYVAAFDAGFRRDAFTFGIGHVSTTGKVEIDVLRTWKPDPGQSVDPLEVIDQITPLVLAYRIITVGSDQHSFEALSKLCLQHGWNIERTEFSGQGKNNILGNLKQLVEQKNIRLLDNPEALAELKNLQRKVRDSGNVSISAPGNQHDDLAIVIALIANRCIWFMPEINPIAPKQPTLEEQGNAQAARKAARLQEMFDA
jgi:hypothetical protein